MLPPTRLSVLLHFEVCLRLYVIPKQTLWELEPPKNCYLVLKMNTLKECGQASWRQSPLGSHMVDSQHLVNMDTPVMIGWIIGGNQLH